MSSKPTAPDSGLQRLIDERYEIEVLQQHLVVRSIPYVNAKKEVKRGVMVCKFLQNGSTILPPAPPEDSHQVWWAGDYPCFADGTPMQQLENEHTEQQLFEGCIIQHRFSNKPEGCQAFPDHYAKVSHYIGLIQAQAKAIDPDVDARTGRVIDSKDSNSVFCYADTASARAEIIMTSARLAKKKVAIVGAGGTGAYILDQVAKCPVAEIHLFDGDRFLQHNAFRSPGAATRAEIEAEMFKTDYLKAKYSAMHRGIVSHAYYLDRSNVSELDGFDFVFVCVDKGSARALLCTYLQQKGIPFADTGMNLQMVAQTQKLIGTCRVTLCTSKQNDHIGQYVPTDEAEEDTLYRQNVQVADMNALNAQLAVIKWKQHCGFYQDDFYPHNLSFSANQCSLSRDVTPQPTP